MTSGADGTVRMSMCVGVELFRLRCVRVPGGAECVAVSNLFGQDKTCGKVFTAWIDHENAWKKWEAEGKGEGLLSVYDLHAGARFVPWRFGRGRGMLLSGVSWCAGDVEGRDEREALLCGYEDVGGEDGIWGKLRVLVGTSNNQIFVCDLYREEMVPLMQGHRSGAVSCVCAHPCLPNIMVSFGEDGSARMWDVVTHELLHVCEMEKVRACPSN